MCVNLISHNCSLGTCTPIITSNATTENDKSSLKKDENYFNKTNFYDKCLEELEQIATTMAEKEFQRNEILKNILLRNLLREKYHKESLVDMIYHIILASKLISKSSIK
jgi:CRISPR/Cas system endoribonuclease Cas6 (RAMP superfamily)